jgi:hypothetical protein
MRLREKPLALLWSLIRLRVDSESRFAIFLARILWKMRLASRKNISASLLKEKCNILCTCESCNLRDSQTSKIIIHSEKLVLDPKLLQDSRKTPELKLVMILASLATKFLFVRLASLTMKFVCETCEKRVLLQNFFLQDL